MRDKRPVASTVHVPGSEVTAPGVTNAATVVVSHHFGMVMLAAIGPTTGASSAAGFPAGIGSSGTIVSGTSSASTAANASGSAAAFHSATPSTSGTSTAPPITCTLAIRAYDAGDCAARSARFVSGPTATTVSAPSYLSASRPISSGAVSATAWAVVSSRGRPVATAAWARHSRGHSRPPGPGSARPQAIGTDGSWSTARRRATSSTPGSHPTSPVAATVTASTDTSVRRSRKASATRSSGARSVSKTTGMASESGAGAGTGMRP